jgi:hypothetical protein
MIDNEFDGFVNGKLGDHEVPVPAGLWEKLTNAQFDQFVGNKLKGNEAPVPEDSWDKITAGQFDSFVSDKLTGAEAAVPTGFWDRVTDGQFDAFVSGRLSGAKAAVPAGLWDKVNPQKEDNDRGGFAWFRNPGRAIAVAAVLIALIGGYFWIQSSNNKNTSTAPGTTLTQPSGAGTTTSGNNGAGNNTPNATNQANALAGSGKTSDAQTQQQSTPANEQAAGSNASEQRVQPAKNGLTPGIPASINGASANNVAGSNGARNGGSNIAAGNGLIQSNNSNNNNAAVTDNNSTDQTQNNGNPFDFIEPYQQNHLQAGATIPFPRNGQMSNLSDKHLSAGNHTKLAQSIIVCPSDKGLNKDWFLEGYFAPDFAFSKVSSNGASQAYMDRKDSSETMNPGFSAGIRVVKPLTDNILLKAGVQYSQMNQKYVYRTENEIKTITVVSLRTIIRAPGDTVIVRDTSVLQQAGFKNNTVINRFRSFDLPLTVGYQFGNDDDWKIGINAGVVINMSSWYEGVVLDTSLATVPITKGSSNSVYKNKIGLGLIGGISIMKKLSDDIQIFAEPYFRYNLSNTTTPNAPFNQKFSIGGIQLGVRLNLNRQ